MESTLPRRKMKKGGWGGGGGRNEGKIKKNRKPSRGMKGQKKTEGEKRHKK